MVCNVEIGLVNWLIEDSTRQAMDGVEWTSMGCGVAPGTTLKPRDLLIWLTFVWFQAYQFP